MTYNLLVLGTYPVDTAEGGGKYVINKLFERLPGQFHVIFLSLVESDKTNKRISITTNFENIHIPQNIEQAKIQWEEERRVKTSLFDVIQINHWEHNINFTNHVKKYLNSSDVIILEHPYFANLVKSLNITIPVIYHAHNVELIQKESILSQELLKNVKNVEKLACDISSQIWVSSETERDILTTTYEIPNHKLKLLPHGVDLSSSKFIDRDIHTQTRSKMKALNRKTIFVFIGSWHPPNLESLEFIISELAPLNENYLFFVIGGVRDYYFHKYSDIKVPANVILFGPVSNDEKAGIYALADYAINPMFSGAGTNLKMLEYMAVGLPMISTDFGARGIKISNKTLICKKEKFSDHVREITHTDYANSHSIMENYDIVRSMYDYDLISKNCTNYLHELLNPKLAYLEDIFGNVNSELNNMTIRVDDPIIDAISKEEELLINFNT